MTVGVLKAETPLGAFRIRSVPFAKVITTNIKPIKAAADEAVMM
jgi:hypothetical protein